MFETQDWCGAQRPARFVPWWQTQAHLMYRRIKSVHESAAMDVDELTAPKDIWFDEKLLKEWYDNRKAERNRRLESESYASPLP